MKQFKYFIIGFLGFVVITCFNVSLGVVLYSKVQTRKKALIALILIILILVNALLCSIIDLVRRKFLVSKPLQEILNATKSLAKGNFNIKLATKHTINEFDEFDLIKNDLNIMAKELSKNEMLKQDFISNISHEIKTPLAVIQNYSKALEDELISKEIKDKYLKNLQTTCKKLTSLVSNILKLNKLEHQTLVVNKEKFNLSNLLTEQVLNFDSLYEEKNIKINCDIDEDLFIESEKSYLEIIINNLISNAVKFSNNNSNIYISLKEINNHYILSVEDEGIGMDEETGKHIFDKFYQKDTSHSSSGNGLGLALVKKVIDLIGGTIKVESELNKGTKFEITLRE